MHSTVLLIPTMTINDTVHLYSNSTVCTQVDFTALGQEMLSVLSWACKEKHFIPMATGCIKKCDFVFAQYLLYVK